MAKNKIDHTLVVGSVKMLAEQVKINYCPNWPEELHWQSN